MSEGGFSLMQFFCMMFYNSLTSSSMGVPNTTDRCKIVESLLLVEQEPDEEKRNRVLYLYQFVNDTIKLPLPILEMTILKNIGRGLQSDIDVNGRDYKVAELYAMLDEVDRELAVIVVGVAKKYNLDVPFTALATGGGKVSI